MWIGSNEPCPKCKSGNNVVQSVTAMAFGEGLKYECRSCGHKWKK